MNDIKYCKVNLQGKNSFYYYTILVDVSRVDVSRLPTLLHTKEQSNNSLRFIKYS